MGTQVDFLYNSLGRNFTFAYADMVKTAGLALLSECHQDYPQPEDVTAGMTYVPADMLMMRPFKMSYYSAVEKAREDIARMARQARREQNLENKKPVLV